MKVAPVAPTNVVLKALRYADKFCYPLTCEEIFLWLPDCRVRRPEVLAPLKKLVAARRVQRSSNLYFLSGRQGYLLGRKSRAAASLPKWRIVRRVAAMLKYIPTVQMIAVTGSLAVNNAGQDDDIDLMIVTDPNTLWITRFIVWSILKSKKLRRATLTTDSSHIKDKICDNLYLDSSQMTIGQSASNRFYLAHEILQAKPVFDRSGVYSRFLWANSWVSEILPNAYRFFTKSSDCLTTRHSDFLILRVFRKVFFSLLYPLNLLFFVPQWLYMRPKMTVEKISLHWAFFHPRAPLTTLKPLL